MLLDPTSQQAQIRERATKQALTLGEHAASYEHAEAIPSEVFRSLGDDGLMAVATPASLGGSDAGTIAYSLAMTEVAQGCAATAVTMAVTNMVGEVIARFGSETQKTLYCPKLAAGGLGAFALSEADAGSDPGGMRTKAERCEEGWKITGAKQWISHGDLSEVVVVWARTGGDSHKGISCFLVPGNHPNLISASKEDKMGLRASHTVSLQLDDIVVGEDALLGELGGGFRVAMMALDGGRIGIGSQALGIATGAFRRGLALLRSEEIDLSQDMHFRIADMRMRLDAMRLLVLRAAGCKERGERFSSEASVAKAFCTEGAWNVCQQIYLLLSELGIASDAVERALRDVRVTMIYEGTSEIQRIVIARDELTR